MRGEKIVSIVTIVSAMRKPASSLEMLADDPADDLCEGEVNDRQQHRQHGTS
jgi:hypothetical protein